MLFLDCIAMRRNSYSPLFNKVFLITRFCSFVHARPDTNKKSVRFMSMRAHQKIEVMNKCFRVLVVYVRSASRSIANHSNMRRYVKCCTLVFT